MQQSMTRDAHSRRGAWGEAMTVGSVLFGSLAWGCDLVDVVDEMRSCP